MDIKDVVRVWKCLKVPLGNKARLAEFCIDCRFVGYCDALLTVTKEYTQGTSEGIRAALRGSE